MIFGLTFLAAVNLLLIFVNAAIVATIREDKKEFAHLHGEIWPKFGRLEEGMDNMRALSAEYGALTKQNYASLEEIFRERH